MVEDDEILITADDCETTPYDVVEFLTEERDFSLFLKISFEENGFKGLQDALIDVARAKAINDLAKKTGLPRDEVYRAFSQDKNPSENMLNKILDALNIKSQLKPAFE